MNSLPVRQVCRATAPVLVLLLLIGVCCGQDREVRPDEQRAAHLARMKALAGSIHVYAAPGMKESEAKLVSEPVLRYTDNTRKNDESSLWIWGSKGSRPTAIVAIEYYPNYRPQGPSWLYEIASLSAERISVERNAAKRGDELAWTAKEPGLALATIADADPPADKPVRRLAQMKTLRARFAIHERTPTEGRIELRPLTSPLYRYEDAASAVIDGAIFSFANGTNPEVLLVLEAYKTKDAEGWRYGLVQMTGAVVAVQLDGKQVWERGEADPPAVRESYLNGWIAAEVPGK
jgi:hypothetical protein